MNQSKALLDKPLPRPDLGNVIKFWTERGTFNQALYLRICAIKSNDQWTERKDKSKD